MVFCNKDVIKSCILITCGHNPYFNRWFSAIHPHQSQRDLEYQVTILILIDGFLQYRRIFNNSGRRNVTILILIDGFLQYYIKLEVINMNMCHNPYFNRWFSAMFSSVWVSGYSYLCHNPYFNRWFSAIKNNNKFQNLLPLSQSLF